MTTHRVRGQERRRRGAGPGHGPAGHPATLYAQVETETSLSGELSMAAGDYVEAFVYQTSGANRAFGNTYVTVSFGLQWFSL